MDMTYVYDRENEIIAEQFFILNPIIKQYQKKYVLGTNKDAKSIFQELCTRRIHIDGFIDSQNEGMLFFHKPVYAMKEVDINKENAILLSLGVYNELSDYHVCTQICILNPKLYGKKIMIYGAGTVGEKVFSILQDQNIDVIGFIDSDESKVGLSLLGKRIYSKDVLQTLNNEVVIVESGKRYYEIDNTVKSVRKDLMRIYLADEMPFELNDIWVDRERCRQVGIWPIAQLGEYCEHEQIKEIVLYGNDSQLAKKYAEVFECLDFGAVTFMTDWTEKNGETILIDEIIYKENFLLLWYGEDDEYASDKLDKLGVDRRYCGKVISVGQWYVPTLHTRKACLDVNLGYTFDTNCEYPGIYIYGGNRKDDYRIAILGNSTTESIPDSHISSWVEMMYRQYCKKNITIFNGGTSGYNSAQELIKLIRDILKLNPDMIIVYDGFNDIVLQNAPKFQYLEKLIHYAGKYMPQPWYVQSDVKAVWQGIPSATQPIDTWLDNVKIMYAIARSMNIEFFAFMQPMLYTKRNLDPHSKTLLLQTPLFYKESFMKAAIQFRRSAKKLEKQYGYLYDLTYIFDDYDVYMDVSHVYELGNEIIARHIWSVIKNCIE